MNNKDIKLLNEVLTKIEENQNNTTITENTWSKIKYGLSKLGRYKAGGKIFGKNKATKEANEKIRKILNKESNKLLRALDNQIKEMAPEFPNDEKPITFMRAILTYSAFYDSIVEATKKDLGEEGYLPVDAANEIIVDLREMVKKHLDYDITSVYTTMESEETTGNILTSDDVDLIYEKNLLKKAASGVSSAIGKVRDAKDSVMDKAFGSEKGASQPRRAGSRASAKLAKTSGSGNFDSERMGKNGLDSNTLPVVLTSIGSALGAFGWMTKTEWFKKLFEEEYTWTEKEETLEAIKSKVEGTLGTIEPGQGFTQLLNVSFPGLNLSPSSSPQELISAMEEVGGGDLKEGIRLLAAKGGIFQNPSEAKEVLMSIAENPTGNGSNLGEIFQGEWAGTGKTVGDKLVTVSGGNLTSIITKVIYKTVIKTVVKTGVKTGATWVAAKGLGAILAPIGVGLVALGTTVKVLREKGKRQSRAKTLDDLLQSLLNVEPTDSNPSIKDVKELESDKEKNTESSESEGDVENQGGSDVNSIDQNGDDVDSNPDKDGEMVKVPSEFIKGNRNMQLAYLASNFLPKGEDFWERLKLKRGSTIPSGFLDASLGQGKVKPEEYIRKQYDKYKKSGSFKSDITLEEFVGLIKDKTTSNLIRWVRNTRKNPTGLISAIKRNFKDFEIGDRQKAKVSRPGSRGKSMGSPGTQEESIKNVNNLLNESKLSNLADSAGFDSNVFMKNLPQFMSMLSAMYYSVKGSSLPYNKEAVLSACSSFGCGKGSKLKMKRTKDSDYNFDYMGDSKALNEEINKIKSLINRLK